MPYRTIDFSDYTCHSSTIPSILFSFFFIIIVHKIDQFRMIPDGVNTRKTVLMSIDFTSRPKASTYIQYKLPDPWPETISSTFTLRTLTVRFRYWVSDYIENLDYVFLFELKLYTEVTLYTKVSPIYLYVYTFLPLFYFLIIFWISYNYIYKKFTEV